MGCWLGLLYPREGDPCGRPGADLYVVFGISSEQVPGLASETNTRLNNIRIEPVLNVWTMYTILLSLIRIEMISSMNGSLLFFNFVMHTSVACSLSERLRLLPGITVHWTRRAIRASFVSFLRQSPCKCS